MKRILFISILILFTAQAQAADSLFLLQDTCVRCHLTSESPGTGNSVISWKKGVHFGPDTSCAECHGGNKFLYMKFKKDHMGVPKGSEINDMCGKCHVNEIEATKTRVKFKNPTKKACEATCVTCHSHHEVEKANLSVINKGNCGKCHVFEKAEPLKQAIIEFQEKVKTLEAIIQKRAESRLPVTSAVREISENRGNLKKAFHAMTSPDLVHYIHGDLIPALSDLESDLSRTGQRNWVFQGIFIILFLILCLIFVKYYQRR